MAVKNMCTKSHTIQVLHTLPGDWRNKRKSLSRGDLPPNLLKLDREVARLLCLHSLKSTKGSEFCYEENITIRIFGNFYVNVFCS